ncbi:MAG: 60S ribosomal protein L22 [Candidatus Bathyarchaeia archaeon]
MVETRIDVSELKAEGDDVIKELADFLREKTGAEIETLTNEIVVKTEEKDFSKQYLRVLLRKYLHKMGFKDYYRVIGGKENTLTIKGRKLSTEEE